MTDNPNDNLDEIRRRMISDHYTGTSPDSSRYWTCRVCEWAWNDGDTPNHEPSCPIKPLVYFEPPATTAKGGE